MNQMQLNLFLGMVALAFIGPILFFVGWRGRRLDDHPVCRKCRYDLSGRDDEAAPACPECGADLARRRATRIGNRQRRSRVLILGLLLTLLGSGGSGTLFVMWAKQFDLNTVKPVWWLRIDTRSPVLADADRAWKELESRLVNDELQAKQIDGLLEIVMTRQADLNLPWPPFAGGFMENARLKDLVPDDMFYEYLREGMTSTFTFSMRKKLRPESQLVLTIHHGPARFSNNTSITLRDQASGKYYNFTMAYVRGGNADTKQKPGTRLWGSYLGGRRGTKTMFLGRTPKEPGRAELLVGLTWELRFSTSEEAFGRQGPTIPPLLVWKKDLPLSFEVVGDDEPIVTMVEDPAPKRVITWGIRFQSHESMYRDADGELQNSPVGLEIRIDTGSMALAFEVYGSDGEQTIKLGQCSAVSGGHIFLPVNPRGLEPFFERDAIDIILRSNVEVAEANPSIEEFWGGEIIYKDVRIRLDKQEEN